jgi:glycosyltransferase involved in cell wall biosynthesis
MNASRTTAMKLPASLLLVTRLRPVRDTERLREIYQQHTVFAMPSFRETFGTVHLEALSQGLPIIHSRGQGVDGLFALETVSEGVDPHSDTSLADGIARLPGRRESIRKLCISEAQRLSRDAIDHMYTCLYGAVCASNVPEISRQSKRYSLERLALKAQLE